MSAATFTALEQAIQAHIADEFDTDGYVSGWLLTTATQRATDAEVTRYDHTGPAQPVHVIAGLHWMAGLWLEHMTTTDDGGEDTDA